VETNPPRNSRPETHPDDERGRWPQGWRLHRMDRFPDASENCVRYSGMAPLRYSNLAPPGSCYFASDSAEFAFLLFGRRRSSLSPSRRSRPSHDGSARTARSAQGRACCWRGAANPCARAPFWHPGISSRRAAPVGWATPSCWWALSGFFSPSSSFLPCAGNETIPSRSRRCGPDP
jgi:hypothetical protein